MRGCSYVPGGSHILTCADDKTIKLWDAAKWNDVPVDTIVSKHMVKSLPIHPQNFVFTAFLDIGCKSQPTQKTAHYPLHNPPILVTLSEVPNGN